ncbi:protein POLAR LOCALIZATION DURING ASYMMETRIC DIVISION AND REDISTRIBUTION-like [Phragmites australis]|uniref:protein POLAR LOCALIZATION DURING ASYMMETRIC DIVISION AND REDISTRIBUTION-like n=1 Tax=Phragmites australis TaxID=29695 RepID=UPI002D7999E5|nr:protein POLAR LOCALIZATION DURING ASYMMETRIC DIVISION AND REDISTRIBUTION-like [Phragmites australis]
MENCERGRGAGADALPLPLPPRLAAMSASSSMAAAASIRAHLARTASGVDYQASPRSLLSRILLRGGGDGGSGGGFGCRVRLPRRYGGGGREERKDGAEQGDTPRVKVVERAPPELPVETPRSSLGRKKPEEELVSMNLGLGASLVLLLSKSAVELNKMVELRAQMEALVSEIRQAAQRKEKHSAVAPASTSQESNGSTTVKDLIAFPAADVDAVSNCSRTADHALSGRTVVVMDQMEAELQVELHRLQRSTAHGDKRIAPMQGLELPFLKLKTKGNISDSPSRSCVDDGDGAKDDDELDGNAEDEEEDEEAEEEEEFCEDKSPPHGGVSARALERRLHELLQKRQQERIVELESALDSAQRRLHEKEREVVWWRDAAKLVSHRRDESRRSVR